MVDNDLLAELAVSLEIVEPQSFDELCFVVNIPLEGLYVRHAALGSLDDVHGEILDKVVGAFSINIVAHEDFLFVFLVELGLVVLARKIKESTPWVVNFILHTVDVFLEGQDIGTA